MRSKAFHFLVATSLLMHYSTTGRAGQLLCACTRARVWVHTCARTEASAFAHLFSLLFQVHWRVCFSRGSFHRGLRASARRNGTPVIVCPLLPGVMIRLLPNRLGPSLWLLMCAQPLKARLSCRVRGGTRGIFLICLAKLIQPRANE